MHVRSTERNRMISRYSLACILMNLALSSAKLIVGILIRSRAVKLDAINGFSDILSSLVSLGSTMIADRQNDWTHPFGYGRLEYITSMFSTFFILCMALHSIYSTVRELLEANVVTPDYNTAIIVIMFLSMLAKLAYGILSRTAGRRISAAALIMSGTESIGDSVVSASILLTIAISRKSGINLEPWLSIILSLFLVKTGIDMIRECGNKLLGARGDPEEALRLKRLIVEEEAVLNVFNLVLHSYGEDLSVGSVDIEVDETMNVAESSLLVRRIRRRANEIGVSLASVGVYGTNIRDPKSIEMWDRILEIIRANPSFLRAYAFSYDAEQRTAYFSVVKEPSVRDAHQAILQLEDELRAVFPGTVFRIGEVLDL